MFRSIMLDQTRAARAKSAPPRSRSSARRARLIHVHVTFPPPRIYLFKVVFVI